MVSIFIWFFGTLLSWGTTPPWFHLDLLLKNSVGKDPCVQVGDYLAATSSIEIQTCDEHVAAALAVILKLNYSFGRTNVTVIVHDPSGNEVPAPTDFGSDPIAFVEESLNTALRTNIYFAGVSTSKGFTPLFAEFKKQVIQFQDDNLSDLYGNSNYTAEDVFSQVLNSTYPGVRLGISTQDTNQMTSSFLIR
jgi:hypothetical protein